MYRNAFYFSAIVLWIGALALVWLDRALWGALLLPAAFTALGIYDLTQTKHTILRNFPVLGHGRYLMEMVRPGIQQYFVESDTSGRPVPREIRSLVYQRAKAEPQTVPFGTQRDVYAEGYEWVNHTLAPIHVPDEALFVEIGGPDCQHPYRASLLNVSAMSYGSLSKEAVRAINQGAKAGGFAHNTGEGGVSPHHLAPEGDLIWQVGTGYFGCRAEDGGFSPEAFEKNAKRPQVKMIELKLSQGAKPGKGGILPGPKVTPEIAEIRGVEVGKTVISPSAHSAFSTPLELCQFLKTLRELSGGKPVGFKLCVGARHEFLAVLKAMQETQIYPDYIAVDGGEGATGAAPLEFTNSVGTPMDDGLVFVVDALKGFGLKDRIRVIASGKIFTAFDMMRALCLGADLCYSARGMLLALGCIQALECHEGTCPTGITTHDPSFTKGLVIADKALRVERYHDETIHALAQLMGAVGVTHEEDLSRRMIQRRISRTEIRTLAEIYPNVDVGSFLEGEVPAAYAADLALSQTQSFAPKSMAV